MAYTRLYKDCLEILTVDNSKYLLFGYLYNDFYTASELEDAKNIKGTLWGIDVTLK